MSCKVSAVMEKKLQLPRREREEKGKGRGATDGAII
jgi:hypothetical protein